MNEGPNSSSQQATDRSTNLHIGHETFDSNLTSGRHITSPGNSDDPAPLHGTSGVAAPSNRQQTTHMDPASQMTQSNHNSNSDSMAGLRTPPSSRIKNVTAQNGKSVSLFCLECSTFAFVFVFVFFLSSTSARISTLRRIAASTRAPSE